MRTIYVIVAIAFLSCKTYIPYEPIEKESSYPVECADIFKLVNENWAKHRQLDCHRYFVGVETFAFTNKTCIQKLRKPQVESLFGPPDEEGPGSYYYLFKHDCDDKKELGVSYFLIIFEGDSIKWVDAGEMEFKEIKQKE